MAVIAGGGLENSGAMLPTSLSLFNAVEGTSSPECFWKHLALDSRCSPHCKLCGDPRPSRSCRRWLALSSVGLRQWLSGV